MQEPEKVSRLRKRGNKRDHIEVDWKRGSDHGMTNDVGIYSGFMRAGLRRRWTELSIPKVYSAIDQYRVL